jgi:hypothetical protein
MATQKVIEYVSVTYPMIDMHFTGLPGSNEESTIKKCIIYLFDTFAQ